MSLHRITGLFQFFWMFESHHHQRLAWKDAARARIARDRAETQSAAQLQAMLVANPSGALGDARLDDADNLKRSGLL
jgi:hypothetical protein